ncbi:NADH-quinone oxidoreductase subunit NuoB [Acetobacterium fimetarium]|uniref:NADH-quinone oxidoreductase subunit NuoB n=1 Tax=Acetobacterium fimetarium TaxID=52691 RepID=A0ABR6WTS3_9FIRM|nr:NADH-quinone oxidoreductase subunit NuoB [Acetobacterium fimetarium]MBC3804019.1 NADH-quinone oxidoreductase subunit NuoB [Acetobacterium fimetarium]
MFNTIKKIIKYPNLTQNYPRKALLSLPKTGKTVIDMKKCTGCGECLGRCPSQAIVRDAQTKVLGINLDTCVFCTLCEEICPSGAIAMTNQFELAEEKRTALRSSTLVIAEDQEIVMPYEAICAELVKRIRKTFGRSLNIREVDAGSCNGCDYEINAMNNPFNDVERLGMHFVASPRHADMLLVTGTATRNMQLALIKTYNATPDPKLVVAVGACACSGGIFRDSYATSNGIDNIVPVDVYIPGCPPRPQAIIYGILKAIEKL